MLFNSWEFVVLLLATLSLYYLPLTGSTRRVWQVLLLLVASAVFYAWNEPRLLILLGASCLLNAVAVERILYWKGRSQCFGESVDASRLGESVNEGSKEPSGGTGPCAETEAPLFRHTETPKHRNTAASANKAKSWLCWTVALNLAFLAFFKYAGFLAGLLPETPITDSLKHWASGIPLPVGISFYTFQGISLVVDVWRDDVSKHTKQMLAGRGAGRLTSIRDTSFYIAFFPQLVAGPIVKAHEFVDQIGGKYFRDIDWQMVRRNLVLGYFLKVFVADNLSEHTAYLATGREVMAQGSPFNLVPLLYAYTLQIFADFGGYSLIAIGLAALFGYRFPINFNFPYLSTSITEFWRRWHMSLSAWLRDYLYIPLGGNRKGPGRTYVNLFLVMFLGGLWHGAEWKFALWGSLHGLLLALERLFGSVFRKDGVSVSRKGGEPVDRKDGEPVGRQDGEPVGRQDGELVNRKDGVPLTDSPKHRFTETLKHLITWFFTFHAVMLLWLTFLMPDMASIQAYFQGVFSGRTNFTGPPAFSLVFYGTAVVLYHAWGWLREHRQRFANKLLDSPLEAVVQGIMLFLIITNPGAPRGFIYFQF
jgi:alginate O-acetyltransferase complex protein AlgI